MQLKRKAWILLLPLGALLMALCLLFPQIGWIEWLAMMPALLYVLSVSEREKPSLRRMYLLGLLYFGVFYLTVWHWFADLYPMAFAGVTNGEAIGLILICWIGLSTLQATLSAFVFPIFSLLARTRVAVRFPALKPFLFALLYTVAEWGQTLTWAGVPWARLALGQAQCGVLWNSAALFGSYFITFALVSVNALAAYAVLHTDRLRFSAFACMTIFLCNFLSGCIGYALANRSTDEGYIVAAVQGNVGSSAKWSEESNQRSYEIYEKYTAEAAAAGARLVVFPETFVPYRITADSALGRYVSNLAKTYRVTIRCGGFHYGEDGGYYNGVFTVYPDGQISETVYAKRRPVPFGEYVPMRSVIELLIPPLADMSMLSLDLDAGKDSAVVQTELGLAGTLICFDSIYEGLALDAVRDGAAFICLPTNDSWFLDSRGVYMHHHQARLRAIESGRYIIRAADTGISSVIAPDGSAHAEQPPLVQGIALAQICPTASRTLYSYIGYLFVFVLISLQLVLIGSEVVLRQRDRKKKI